MKAHKQKQPTRNALALGVLGLLGLASGAADAAVRIEGQVQAGGGASRGFDRDVMGRERRRTRTTGASQNGG